MEIGTIVGRRFAGRGEIVPSELPAGRAVHFQLRGPFDGMPGAWLTLFAWCQAEKLELACTNWEVYMPWEGVDPARLETDLYALLAWLRVTAASARAAGLGAAADLAGAAGSATSAGRSLRSGRWLPPTWTSRRRPVSCTLPDRQGRGSWLRLSILPAWLSPVRLRPAFSAGHNGRRRSSDNRYTCLVGKCGPC
jgi:hypothetical protein